MAFHTIEALRKFDKPGMKKLVMAVKMSHMKDMPQEAITDREAERVLETLTPVTLEKLYKLAVDNDILNL